MATWDVLPPYDLQARAASATAGIVANSHDPPSKSSNPAAPAISTLPYLGLSAVTCCPQAETISPFGSVFDLGSERSDGPSGADCGETSRLPIGRTRSACQQLLSRKSR
jgi:hypothetical protein